jgi:hypothetical protein
MRAAIFIGVTVASLLLARVDADAQPPLPDPVPLLQAMSSAAVSNSGNAETDESQLPGQRPRTTRHPSRGQSLVLTANFLGGHDDNAGTELGSGTGSVPLAPTSGSTAFADLMLEYLRRTPRRSIGVRTLANLSMYPDYLEQPAPGAKARVFGTTELGKKYTLEFSAQARYEPLFTTVLGDANEVAGTSDLTASQTTDTSVPSVQLFERRSLVSSNKAYLTRRWGARDRSVGSYLYFSQHFTGGNGNNLYHQAAISHSHVFSRAVSFGGSYEYQNGRYTDYGAVTRPVIEQTIEGGPLFTKRLHGRQLSVSLRGGGTYVEAVDSVNEQPIATWKPFGSASAAMNLSRVWQVSGGYRRSFSVLQGLTGQLYAVDAADITAAGALTSHTDVTVSTTFGNGRTLLTSGDTDRFNLYGGTAQLRVPLTSTLAAIAGYYLYYQRYSNPAALPTGFPAQYDRHAFVVGLTFWAPLAGNLPASPRALGQW